MNSTNRPAVAGALFTYAATLTTLIWMATACGCGGGCSTNPITVSDGGVRRLHIEIPTEPDGTTVEQRNIRDRLKADNKPGALKHLYVISAYSGQVIIYSTVKGKVTSSGKRLTPYTLSTSGEGALSQSSGMLVSVNNSNYRTPEVIQDDGTYGNSIEYVYWWDTNGRYHQHYNSGGQIIHISDQPLPVKSITINMELAEGK